MKTTKRFISVVLSVLLVLGTLTVTASAKTQLIKWTDFESFDPVYYGGEIGVGTGTFTGKGNYAYKFTAPEEGVYSFKLTVNPYLLIPDDSFSYLSVSESCTNDEAYGEAENFNTDDYSLEYYYFGKGETQFIGVYTSGIFKNYNVEIEYAGKVIDFGFTDDKAVQAGFDVNVDTYGENDENTYIYIEKEVAVKTDKGVTLVTDYISPDVAEGTKLVGGKNKVEVTLLGMTKELEFEVFYLYDVIESAKTLEGFTSPYIILTEDGSVLLDAVIFSDCETDKIELTLKDGSKVLCEKDSVLHLDATLPDGKSIFIPIKPVEEDGKYYFAIELENGEKMIIGEITNIQQFESDTGDDGDDDITFDFGPIMTIVLRIIAFFRDLLSKIFYPVMPV